MRNTPLHFLFAVALVLGSVHATVFAQTRMPMNSSSNTMTMSAPIFPDKTQRMETINALNDLLSDLSITYLNVRGLHWNIRDRFFFALHPKYQEIYEELSKQIDDVAEIILTIGGLPLTSYRDYAQRSRVKEKGNTSDAQTGARELIEALQLIGQREEAILIHTEKSKDYITQNLVSNMLYKQQKTIWMLSSFLGERTFANQK